MKERIKEIIAYIIDAGAGIPVDRIGIHNELENMGYSVDEINQAFTIIDIDASQDGARDRDVFRTRVRVLGEGEKLTLSTEAHGYLLKLYSSGWLTETQLSLVIENAGMEYSVPVSVAEIAEVISRYIPEIPDEILDDTEDSLGSLN